MEALGEAILAQDEAAWNENRPAPERLRSPRADALDRAAVRQRRAMAGSRGYQAAGMGPACRGRDSGDALDHPQLLSAGRHDHPRDGGETPRRRPYRPAPDTHPSFGVGHRIHVPIITYPRVRFMIDGRPVPARGRRGLRDQQPENPQRHEQGRRGPHQLHLRLPAAGAVPPRAVLLVPGRLPS